MKRAITADGCVILRLLIADSQARIYPLAELVATGNADRDQIHRLRRALSQLRTAIKELKPFGRGLELDWDASIAPVFIALGRVRDRQVFLETIAPSLRKAANRCVDPADALPAIDEGQAPGSCVPSRSPTR
jgi:CHAD domain-containing protein